MNSTFFFGVFFAACYLLGLQFNQSNSVFIQKIIINGETYNTRDKIEQLDSQHSPRMFLSRMPGLWSDLGNSGITNYKVEGFFS